MWHRQGKVSLTKGSDVVTGVGTNWVENIRAGDAFQGPDGKLYQVINVASNEALAISPAYEGNTATNLNYWIVPIPGYSKTQADRLSLIISKLDGDIVTATEAADRAQATAQQAQQWRNEAAVSAAAALQSEQSAALSADIAEQAADDAVSVVTDGQGSTTPAPHKFPVAGASGTIQQAWVNSLEFELDALRVAKNKMLYGDGPYPVLDLQFQGAKLLDPRVTFTRATPDWDWDGKRYEANEPVLSDEGLWLWGSRTNLLTYGNDFTMWSKYLTGTGEIQVTSGYGERNGLPTTRVLFTRDVSSDRSFLAKAAPIAVSEMTMTQSAWLRNLGESDVNLTFSISAGESLNLPPKKWIRAALTKTIISTEARVGIILPANSNSADIEVCGVMLEEGGYSTPYIPTEANQVTVAASTLEVLADSLIDKFNPSDGTIVWRVGRNHYSSAAGAPPHANMGIVGSGANNGLLAISGNNLVYHDSNGDYQESLAVPAQPLSNDEFTIAYTYTKTGVSVAHNGDLASAEWDVSEFLENAVKRLYVSGLTNGYVRSLSYYDQALTGEQLQELTS